MSFTLDLMLYITCKQITVITNNQSPNGQQYWGQAASGWCSRQDRMALLRGWHGCSLRSANLLFVMGDVLWPWNQRSIADLSYTYPSEAKTGWSIKSVVMGQMYLQSSNGMVLVSLFDLVLQITGAAWSIDRGRQGVPVPLWITGMPALKLCCVLTGPRE